MGDRRGECGYGIDLYQEVVGRQRGFCREDLWDDGKDEVGDGGDRGDLSGRPDLQGPVRDVGTVEGTCSRREFGDAGGERIIRDGDALGEDDDPAGGRHVPVVVGAPQLRGGITAPSRHWMNRSSMTLFCAEAVCRPRFT